MKTAIIAMIILLVTGPLVALAEEQPPVDWELEARTLRLRVIRLETQAKQLRETVMVRTGHVNVIYEREINEVSKGVADELENYRDAKKETENRIEEKERAGRSGR